MDVQCAFERDLRHRGLGLGVGKGSAPTPWAGRATGGGDSGLWCLKPEGLWGGPAAGRARGLCVFGLGLTGCALPAAPSTLPWSPRPCCGTQRSSLVGGLHTRTWTSEPALGGGRPRLPSPTPLGESKAFLLVDQARARRLSVGEAGARPLTPRAPPLLGAPCCAGTASSGSSETD